MAKPNILPIEQAPNLLELKRIFGVSEDDLIVAYGDKIYCPAVGMSKDLLVHELVHCERQGFNEESARQWWQKYIDDWQFRLQEEALAFRAQYMFCKDVYKDRNKRTKIAMALARELSSDRYGNIVSCSEALEFITRAQT